MSDGSQIGALQAPGMYTWDPKQRRHSIGGVRSIAFSPDGRFLAAGGMGKVGNIDHLEGKARVEVFDIASGARVAEIESASHKGLVESMEFTADGNCLVAAGGDHDGFLMAIDPQQGKILAEEKAGFHIHEIDLVAAAGEVFAVGHQHAALWKLDTGKPA